MTPTGDDDARTFAGLPVGAGAPLLLIAGPCQLQSPDHALMIADALAKATTEAGLSFVFKGSFDKANRTSLGAARGTGVEAGLEILSEVRSRIGCPTITDVHLPDQCALVAKAVDALQIPAFLCRQTDLLLAAGATGRDVNVKKGQFLAPWDMTRVAEKIASAGAGTIMLCERGASFGYNNLVADMRSMPIMARTGLPVCFDASHAVQAPGGLGGASGGDREMTPILARAAVAAGADAIFIETHEDPDNAPSDGPSMTRLEDMAAICRTLAAFRETYLNYVTA